MGRVTGVFGEPPTRAVGAGGEYDGGEYVGEEGVIDEAGVVPGVPGSPVTPAGPGTPWSPLGPWGPGTAFSITWTSRMITRSVIPGVFGDCEDSLVFEAGCGLTTIAVGVVLFCGHRNRAIKFLPSLTKLFVIFLNQPASSVEAPQTVGAGPQTGAGEVAEVMIVPKTFCEYSGRLAINFMPALICSNAPATRFRIVLPTGICAEIARDEANDTMTKIPKDAA